MDKLIHFVGQHWLLVSAFIIVLILLIIEEARAKGTLSGQLVPQKAIQLINHEQAVVVDLRDATIFQEGHIVSAINIPHADFEKSINKLNKYKNRSIIVVCSSGQATLKAVAILKKSGFDKAEALAGGIAAWEKAELPLVKGEGRHGKH